MATQIEVPPLGESVKQAILVAWHKKEGESVATDEPICELETDKANVDVPAKTSGILHHLKEAGETVNVGEPIARIDEGPAGAKSAQTASVTTAGAVQKSAAVAGSSAAPHGEDLSPAVRRLVEEHQLNPKTIPATGPGGRLTKEDVETFIKRQEGNGKGQQAAAPPAPAAPSAAAAGRPAPPPPTQTPSAQPSQALSFDASGVHRVPMSKIRRRIAETLVHAQQTAAILTTFNEVDLTEVINLRNKFREQFEKVYGVSLGFVSFFARATVLALKEVPRLNSFIEGNDIVYHNFVNLGIAVSTDRGLAVPVLRNVQEMSFARIEAEIKRLAQATRDGKLSLDELSGGTFTITNGGVFGSLLSTPILTPPQSGILGLHAIQKRPVVINEQIQVRSMMYIALSYDHRIVDGKEAITFLVRIKQLLEDPARLMLEI
ncbi:MAG TPA: 2-oxoglutarate dehydrogenase complex dihydrolipoyllysine-residue succinyltransferase [Tepidisphaeraceae bacterium]|jgi:2-oxoglutarate dehydrogenase E2 component (dihydrolipoamide succinyltransferase)|nr:2-oxoglutarate dehydrogenase complex dihydrolipoyllysine-residue succinyltransferase [Tepidisphaeraceae bacterium]